MKCRHIDWQGDQLQCGEPAKWVVGGNWYYCDKHRPANSVGYAVLEVEEPPKVRQCESRPMTCYSKGLFFDEEHGYLCETHATQLMSMKKRRAEKDSPSEDPLTAHCEDCQRTEALLTYWIETDYGSRDILLCPIHALSYIRSKELNVYARGTKLTEQIMFNAYPDHLTHMKPIEVPEETIEYTADFWGIEVKEEIDFNKNILKSELPEKVTIDFTKPREVNLTGVVDAKTYQRIMDAFDRAGHDPKVKYTHDELYETPKDVDAREEWRQELEKRFLEEQDKPPTIIDSNDPKNVEEEVGAEKAQPGAPFSNPSELSMTENRMHPRVRYQLICQTCQDEVIVSWMSALGWINLHQHAEFTISVHKRGS